MFVQKQETDGDLMEALLLHNSELIAISGDTKTPRADLDCDVRKTFLHRPV